MKNPRYDGDRFLRLLELYVLWAIDCLPAESAADLEEMAPTLARIYDVPGGTWQQAIEKTMQFAPDLPDFIRDRWRENQEIARANRAVLTPQQFAEGIVDGNWRGEEGDEN